MYTIHFFKLNGGVGRIYAWTSDLDKARVHLEECGHTITGIYEEKGFEWLFYAYIREPHKRYKKWWG